MKKSLLLLAGFAAASFMADAQQIAEGYVTWPASEQLHTYIKAWNGGKGAITIEGYNDDGTNGLPNGKFDSEAFSMWNYLDHYGNWTSPYGWVPGAFADAAHKNGVAVSGVASVPYGGISDSWRSCLSQLPGSRRR